MSLRRLLLFTAALTFAGLLSAQQKPARRALLISNSAYPNVAQVPAAASGASLLRSTLGQLGFDVRLVENATLEQIDTAISKLATDSHPGDIVMLLYMGLAVQSNQENYFLPANFNPTKSEGADYDAYSMRRAASLIEERSPAFFGFIIDAAWDNPVLRQRFPEAGLARLDPNPDRPGALFAMSAAPGKTTGDGSKSLYVQALATTLSRQGLTLNQVVANVKRSVSEASGGAQIPSEVSTVVRDFFFNPRPPDLLAWESLQNSNDRAALQLFTETHPASPYAAQARARLDDLEWRQANKDLASLRAYLSRHPAGIHRAEAETAIVSHLALEAVARYRDAMQSRDLDSLKAVWPTLSKQQIAGFQRFFRDARMIAIEPVPVSLPEVSGTTAVIKLKRSIVYPGQGAITDVVLLHLKRSGDAMLIESQSIEGAKP